MKRTRFKPFIVIQFAALLAFSSVISTGAHAQDFKPLSGEITQAILGGEWTRVHAILTRKDDSTLTPVECLIKAHACLALNLSNESLQLFQGVSKEEDLKQWEKWAGDFTAGNSDHKVALYFKGDAYARLKKWEQALAAFEEGLRIPPKDPHVLLLNARGTALCALGRFEEGLKDLLLATRRDPSFVDAQLSLGAAWISWKRGPDGARKAFQAALENSPDSALALNGLACVEFAEGQWNAGLDRLRKARSKFPWLDVPSANLAIFATMKDEYVKPIGKNGGQVKPGMAIEAVSRYAASLSQEEARRAYVTAEENRARNAFFTSVGKEMQLPDLTHPDFGWIRVSTPAPSGIRIGTSRDGRNPQVFLPGRRGDIQVRLDIGSSHGQEPHINIQVGERNIHTDKDFHLTPNDEVTIRIGGGKIVIEVNGHKVKEYEVPEADKPEETVIVRKPDGTTTVTSGGQQVGEVKEQEGKTTVKVGDKTIEVPTDGKRGGKTGEKGGEDKPRSPEGEKRPDKGKTEKAQASQMDRVTDPPFPGLIYPLPERNPFGDIYVYPLPERDPNRDIRKDSFGSAKQAVRMIVIGGSRHWPPITVEPGWRIPPYITSTRTDLQDFGRELARIAGNEAAFWDGLKNEIKKAHPGVARISEVKGATAEDLWHRYTDRGHWLYTQFSLGYRAAAVGISSAVDE